MKGFQIILILISCIFVNSCDAFRRMAGLPTSADIVALQKKIARQEQLKYQHKLDSMKLVEKDLRDSLDILDSIRLQQYTILNNTKIGGLYTTKLEYKYYVVVGAFKDRSNAESLLNKVKSENYSAILINFRNSFNAVAISPSNDLNRVLRAIREIRKKSFCPEDVWILVNE